jgi:outer membrane biogenesis lipoprotein LolB
MTTNSIRVRSAIVTGLAAASLVLTGCVDAGSGEDGGENQQEEQEEQDDGDGGGY